MLRTTPGELLVNEALPEGLRRYGRVLDSKGIEALFTELAEKHPEAYREAAAKLVRLGADVAYEKGGLSFGLRHLAVSSAALKRRAEISRAVNEISADRSLDRAGKEKRILAVLDEHRDPLDKEVFDEAMAAGNPLAQQIASGVRGKKGNLRSLVGMDLAYVDHRERPVPIPILHSYSEGLRPAEYWAGSYGARKGVLDTKLCVDKDTLVLMGDYGAKAIADVRPRDVVWTWDVEGGARRTSVVRRYDNGPRECSRWIFKAQRWFKAGCGLNVEFSVDFDVVATADHEIALGERGHDGRASMPLRDFVVRDVPIKAAAWLSSLLAGTDDWVSGCGSLAESERMARDVGDGGAVLVSVEPVGNVETCDLEVEDPAHVFVLANGLVVGNSTQEAGYLGKIVTAAAHKLIVTERDSDLPDEEAARIGVPVSTDDSDSVGALLARPVGGYARNAAITPRMLKDLRARGVERMLVRSPITAGPTAGGVYARDVGVRERGRLAPVGDYVGIAGAQALCLAAGTMVRMGDGTEREVEYVVPGEYVLGCDREGRTFPVRVVAAHDNGFRDVWSWRMTARPDEATEARSAERMAGPRSWGVAPFAATAEHKVLARVRVGVGGPFEETAERAEPTAPLEAFVANRGGRRFEARTFGRGGLSGWAALDGREFVGSRPTFDLEVDHPDHLFVLANGLVVSNSEKLSQGSLCLDERTEVRMADGSTREIRDVRPDEEVLGADVAGRTFPVRVVANHDNGERDVWSWEFGVRRDDVPRDSSDAYVRITATEEHKILVRPRPEESNRGGEVIRLNQAMLGGGPVLVEADGGLARGVFLTAMFRGPRPTRDLEVDHPDHLFVLANGLVVSNSSKHGGGVAGAGGAVTGFHAVEKMVNPSASFAGAAAHARTDGRVTAVEDAPQGGRFVWVAGERHYAPTGADLKVKVGDEVEAGDVLSDGVPNPAEVVKYKGVGEGRRYFVEALRDTYRRSGMPADRRNVELFARGLIDNVRMDEETDDFVPDDVVPYSTVAASWTPREGATAVKASAALGKYLEKPVLHYTIGTKVRPSVVKNLQEFGIGDVLVHAAPPPFSPYMPRGVAQAQHDPDWAARQIGPGAGRATLEAARRGLSTDVAGPSYVAPLMLDPASFGRSGLTVGWDPKAAADAAVLDRLLDPDDGFEALFVEDAPWDANA